MVKYKGSVTVPFAQARVFALLADWSNLAAWDVNITESVPKTADTTPGVGAEYACKFRLRGSALDVAYVCREFDAPRFAAFEASAKVFKSRDTIACEPVDGATDRTRVTASFDLAFAGVLQPFSFVMNGAMQQTGPIVMRDIEKFVCERLGDAADAADEKGKPGVEPAAPEPSK